ncbi:MAG: Serine-tRNA ligase [Candidatus Amesbacteria bacterium GW2011_GWA2_47_11b]|uniref:Serine--tRNA ligase n=3 Tax=Candidatus Amesiibacteriota TaxID=1752730 RepID=A0A0G1SHT0_9BACT|nr:MAG: Serine-tRNA ligase [Microgenomates group bacterium GW2011_GWC1_46_20]KKU58187.1 MAG: Serine-tRNA ligase [Candidatus Amesbacteria bacterium GW2011_GWA2_47_11b]KKU68981.1 MAG: Serine-tRNA ligase [Candidatus Amesbacteria bacterium GW2011_GWA1_47_20]KKU84833.1 MAG: Serine-tRNA ligase [Candidatus Amesbacteria bacterium GW2011_GWC2_47_8]
MLDIKFVRDHPDEVQKNIEFRGGKVPVDEVLKADVARRELIQKIEKLRAARNIASSAKPSESEIKKLRQKREDLKKLEDELQAAERLFLDKLARLPNMSSDQMPEGKGDADHMELVVWIPGKGYLPKDKLGKGYSSATHMPKTKGKHHLELGKDLDIIDTEQSALTSGSRFAYLKGDAALLQFALFELFKNKLIAEGFEPMIVPVMVKERVLFGTSHFPEGRDQVYQVSTENIENHEQLFLVGSSEPPLFAYYMDKTLKEADLPRKFFAYTHCFRSEVGSWGKDVRGIKRVHQFDKLEIDALTTAEGSHEMMEYLRGLNEWLMQQLQLPYRVINKCSRDCGYNATYLQYDLEGWLPSQGEYIELGSNTDAWDYQARRLNIHYVDTKGDKKLVHTVNDTGIPMGRMIITILDNYQNPDGSITIPEVLRPYMRKDKIVPK